MKSLLVGIGHKAHQGKDTLGWMIHEELPRHSRVYGFSDAIKAYCRVVGLMRGKKDPELLQTIGLAMRNHTANKWIACLEYRILEESPPIAIITDMRYTNEANWITQNNGITIKVSRFSSSTDSIMLANDRSNHHPSEIDLDDYSFNRHVKNIDGDLDRLWIAASKLTVELKARVSV